MEISRLEGKSIEEILENIDEKVVYKELEEKSGLFKGKKKVIEVVRLSEVAAFIKDYLDELIKNMGMDANIETKVRENVISVAVYSEDSPLLIGKNGRTIDAIKTILKQVIYSKTGMNIRFSLDIGEYNKKKEKRIELIAKQAAREVENSKIEVKLDSMNSYERRLVHEVLSDNNKIITESVGEEPNRCVVIKLKK